MCSLSKEQFILSRETIQHAFFRIIPLFWLRLFIRYQTPHSRPVAPTCGFLGRFVQSQSICEGKIEYNWNNGFCPWQIRENCAINEKIVDTSICSFSIIIKIFDSCQPARTVLDDMDWPFNAPASGTHSFAPSVCLSILLLVCLQKI